MAAAHRDWEWHYLHAQVDQSVAFQPMPAEMSSLGQWLSEARKDPKLAKAMQPLLGGTFRIRTVPKDRKVFLCNDALPEGRLLAGIDSFHDGPWVTPDGRYVAVRGFLASDKPGATRLWLYAIDGGRPLWSHPVGGGPLAFSPTRPEILVVDEGMIGVWDMGDGTVRWRQRAHREEVSVVAYSADGKHFATGGLDHAVKVWDAGERRLLREFHDHAGPVTQVCFSPDGMLVASGGAEGVIRVRSLQDTGQPTVLVGHVGAVHRLAFEPDGSVLQSIGEDGWRRWLVRPRATTQFRFHRSLEEGNRYPYVTTVAFSADGRRLASGGWDDTICIVDLDDGSLVRTLASGRIHAALAFDAHGRLFANPYVTRWDPLSGARQAGTESAGGHFAISPNGKQIVAARADGKGLVVLNATDLSVAAHWPDALANAIATWSRSGDFVAAVDEHGSLEVYEASSGSRRFRVEAHGGRCWAVAIHPSRPIVATGGSDGLVRIWNAVSGELVRELKGHTGHAYALDFHPGGTRLASGSEDATVRIWDFEAGIEKLRLTSHTAYVKDLAFSPDGTTLASASGDNSVRVWSTRSEREHFEGAGRR